MLNLKCIVLEIDQLQTKDYFCPTLKSLFFVSEIFQIWNGASPGAYQLLVLSDDVLPDINISSAMWLIHYNLPRTWTHFSNRFYTLHDNYQSTFATIDVSTHKLLTKSSRVSNNLPYFCFKFRKSYLLLRSTFLLMKHI